MPRAPHLLRRALFLLCGAAVLLLLPGCGDGDRSSYATEGDEPGYRSGQSLLKSGRKQEALSAFLKVIEKRGDDASESHLEAGLLYYAHINDPIAAIYHFKKYLALRPNSPQAPLVKQRIDAAIREFARTLPAQPLENTVQRVDLIAELDKLKLENEMLKQQVADLKAGREPAEDANGTATAPAANPAAAAPAAGGNFTFSTESMPVVRTRPVAAEPAGKGRTADRKAKTIQAPSTAPETKPAPAKAGARKHTVRQGDTLSKLAQQYYGSRAKWRDIFNANRKVMRNEGDLHVGLELVIP
jgi:LysM repeat protein